MFCFQYSFNFWIFAAFKRTFISQWTLSTEDPICENRKKQRKSLDTHNIKVLNIKRKSYRATECWELMDFSVNYKPNHSETS